MNGKSKEEEMFQRGEIPKQGSHYVLLLYHGSNLT